MRWCVALALVLVALVAVTVKAARRTTKKSPVIAPEIGASDETRPVVPPPAAPPEPPSAPHESSGNGIAYLHGHVLFPAGGDKSRYLAVVAEGDDRTFDAQVLEGGRFQFHLPPGRYTLIASVEELVGVATDVLARGGAERDIDIRLGMGATIRGRVRGATDVSVGATSTDRDHEYGVPNVENGAFSIAGLIPGRLYDVTFTGVEVRNLTLSGIRAPADGLEVELRARAQVRGAIGFPRGGECPITSAHLRIGGEDQNEFQNVGGTCTFELGVRVDTTPVTVVAKGKGWYLEEEVAIPAAGDPDPICLNPPCLSDRDMGFARLRLALDGAGDDPAITAEVWSTSDARGNDVYHSCSGSAGSCDVEGLAAGEKVSITAGGKDCRAEPMTLTVVAGDNHVRIPCHRQRRIEGVIRIPEDQQPDAVTVRCAGGDWHPMNRTRLFQLTCDAGIRALEYRIGSQGTLRSVPIASLAGSGPAFVDIGY